MNNILEITKERLKQAIHSQKGFQNFQLDSMQEKFLEAVAWELCAIKVDQVTSEASRHKAWLEHLFPEILNRAQPAHALAKATPIKPIENLSCEHILYTQTTEGAASVYFSPLFDVQLVNARVLKHVSFNSHPHCNLHPGVVWLGIELDPDIQALDELIFFFDWPEVTQQEKDACYERLTLMSCCYNNKIISFTPGFSNSLVAPSAHYPDLEQLQLLKLECSVATHYAPRFLRVNFSGLSLHQSKVPPGLEIHFEGEALSTEFSQELLWLEWSFPTGFTQELINNTKIELNCFPVLNRKLDNTGDFRTEGLIKTIRLCDTEERGAAITVLQDQFLGIRRIWSNDQPYYRPLAYRSFATATSGAYSIQQGNIERTQNTRDIWHLVSTLQFLLQEQQNSLGNYEREKLNLIPVLGRFQNDLEDLDLILEQVSPEEKIPHYYLHVKASNPGVIFVRYWKTQGDLSGISLKSGTPLIEQNTQLLQSNSACLLTRPIEGRGLLNEIERLSLIESLIIKKSNNNG